jgi:hypothetical protein
MPTSLRELYLWLLVITVANYLVVVKHARNDYISIGDALFPYASAWDLFTGLYVMSSTLA